MLFIDRLSVLRRQRLKKELKSIEESYTDLSAATARPRRD
jgi:hypothetical protein